MGNVFADKNPVNEIDLFRWREQLSQVFNNTMKQRIFTAAGTAGAEALILCDATAGIFTLALPKVSNALNKRYRIMKVDASANAITVDPNGSETINGGATETLSAQYDYIDINSVNLSTGDEWLKFSA